MMSLANGGTKLSHLFLDEKVTKNQDSEWLQTASKLLLTASKFSIVRKKFDYSGQFRFRLKSNEVLSDTVDLQGEYLITYSDSPIQRDIK